MKKAILLIAMALSISLAFSQSFFKVVKVNSLEYNNDSKKWATIKTNQPENMMIIINGSKIKVTDNANSVYMTYKQTEKKTYIDHTTSSWLAYDEKGRDCTVVMTMYDGRTNFLLTILYLSAYLGYEYIVEPQD